MSPNKTSMSIVHSFAGLLLILAVGSYVYLAREVEAPAPVDILIPDATQEVVENPIDTLGATTSQDQVVVPDTTTFSGILEEVNTGCFADGECYVRVSGIHITTLLGRRQEVVGSVIGVPGFGDIENFVGEQVEVYAQKLADGTYTLYGSEDFYIKLSSGAGVAVQMGETVEAAGVQLTPLLLMEDSRCPIDVVCIQAGTVRVQTRVVSAQGVLEQIFVLNETVETEGGKITLLRVEPSPESTTSIDAGQYVFYFEVRAR